MIYLSFDPATGNCNYTVEVPVPMPELPDQTLIETQDTSLLHADPLLLYLKDGEIRHKPACPDFNCYSWDTQAETWELNLDSMKAIKSKQIALECRRAIEGGFESSALGVTHQYPSKGTDQQNLNGSVVASLLESDPAWTTPFWCADENGVWEFFPHTAAQIQQVGRECKTHILTQMNKNKALQERVANATSAEELEALSW
jgi:hypothetical protein